MRTQRHPRVYNLSSTISNAEGLYISMSEWIPWHIRLYCFLVTLASILMHLSETKHGLSGIPPFRAWTTELLMIDRVLAVSAMLYGCYLAYWYPEIVTIQTTALLFVGLIGLVLSERVFVGPDTILLSLCCHAIWHLAAYRTMSIVLTTIYYK